MTKRCHFCTFLALSLFAAGALPPSAEAGKHVRSTKGIEAISRDSIAMDAAVVTIIWPPHFRLMPNITENPKAIFANFGTEQATFDVHFEIDSSGTNCYTGNVQSITLDPNTETTWVFTPSWTTGPNNGITYDALTYVILQGDSNTSNDTLPWPINSQYIGTWEYRSLMPVPEMCHATAYDITGDCIYTFGGYHGGSIYHSYTQQYSIVTNSWQVLPGMPSSRAWIDASVASWKRSIYIFGGFDGTVHDSTFIYEIDNENWSTGTLMPSARAAGDQVAYNDSLIYYIGGYDDSTATTDVQLYNTYTDTWTVGTPLLTPHMMGGAELINDTIWIVGGHDGVSSHTNLYYGVIYPSSCETIAWHTGDPLPFPVYGNATGDYPSSSLLFLVGGMAYEDTPNRSCWQYSQYSAWVDFGPLPYPMLSNNSLVVNSDYIYLCGADHTGNWNPVNEVWSYFFF
jgi:hypothetical protein